MSDQSFPFSLVVFDFDGTLAEPTLDFSLMQAEGLKELRRYVDVPLEVTKLTLEDISAYSQRLEPKAAAAMKAAVEGAFKAVEVEAATRSRLFAPVRPMLKALAEGEINTAIITRNCRKAVLTVFPDLGSFTTKLFTREDVEQVKPHPEHLLAALSAWATAPEKTLMVGDHPMDIEVGKKTGTATAGVASGESSPQRLEKSNPDYLAPDIGSLMTMLGILR